MATDLARPGAGGGALLPRAGEPTCAVACTGASADELNRQCLCAGVDLDSVRAALDRALQDHDLRLPVAQSHANLFSVLPVFVSQRHLDQVAAMVAATEAVVASEQYRTRVLGRAPAIARFDPGTRGGLLGFDFHLDAAGPRLIEINTNPGGALLNALVTRAQRSCAGVDAPSGAPPDPEDQVIAVLIAEWTAVRGATMPASVAIVDATPEAQFLYPEFVLYRDALRRLGVRAAILAPEALERRGDGLWHDGARVDLVYNRLTDFALEATAHAALRESYLAGEIVLTPHPRAHALYADKRNLVLLGDRAFLATCGLADAAANALAAAVPRTRRVDAGNRDALWAERRSLFFKPAGGFGGKAGYRGDKITRRAWEEVLAGDYVAQDLVRPSERASHGDDGAFKLDLRCYAYAGRVLLHAARTWRGQVTNFRTPGGGFAPVLVVR